MRGNEGKTGGTCMVVGIEEYLVMMVLQIL
jgi:hypothetical protein